MADFARSLARAAAPVALLSSLAACGGGGGSPTPTPVATQTPVTYDVTSCLNQTIPGTNATVASLVVPDTITVNLQQPSGFPNGRRLEDPVIDITLAALFLDLSKHSPLTFFNMPLNPPANDRPFRSDFPYLAPPQGNPPLSGSDTVTTFDFVERPYTDYVRVDRQGMPAVSPALIRPSLRNAYNDADPVDDAEGEFVPELQAQLEALTNILVDDLEAAGLTSCATPK